MTTNRAVVCVRDRDLLDTVLRAAAAAGCVVHRVPDAPAARRDAPGARLLVLDPSAAAEWCAAKLPPHRGVVLVCPPDQPDSVYRKAMDVGVTRVIPLPDGQDALVDAFADVAEGPPDRPGPVVAVVGGRGGAGASVFAAALGLAVLHSGHNGLLVDCDPRGGGLDMILGIESRPGLRWSDLQVQSGRVSAGALCRALPALRRGGRELAVLSCHSTKPGPPSVDAVAAVVDAGRRAGHTVVCDLPRTIGEVEQAVLSRATLTVVVVPLDVRSCSAARGLTVKLRECAADVRVLIRGQATAVLSTQDVVRILKIPLLSTMIDQPYLTKSLDEGDFRLIARSPLALATAKVLGALTTLATPAAA